MTDTDAAVEPGDTARATRWPAVAAIAVGLVVGAAVGAVVLGGDDEGAEPSVPASTGSSAVPVDLDSALLEAGVPGVLTPCVVATVGDGGAVAAGIAAFDPLAPGSESREAVEACARQHLADEVAAAAGVSGPDALCVAGELLDRVGLERVLVSIDALAITADVQAAATEAAAACASASG